MGMKKDVDCSPIKHMLKICETLSEQSWQHNYISQKILASMANAW